jgi:hypothetical protein
MQGLCRGWEVLIGALSPPRPALPRLNSEQSELCNAGARAPGRARGGHTEGGISCEDKKAKTRRRHISYFYLLYLYFYYLDASYLDVPNLTRRSTRTAAHFDVVLLLRFN